MFDDHGWEVPKSKDDLFALMDKISTDTNDNVKSMVFCGSIGGYFDAIYPNWFIQYAGVDGFKEFVEYGSADVYDGGGRRSAYSAFAEMLGVKSRFPNNVLGYDHMAAQTAFLNGEAAMIINGGWMETEMSEYLADPIYADFSMKMMPMPQNYASKTADGKLLDATGNEVSDYFVSNASGYIIPKNAVNKEEAKKFLLFLYNEENRAVFTKHSGAVLPCDYSNVNTEGMSTFKKSIVEVYKNAEVLSDYSTAPIYLAGETSMHPNNTNFAKSIWNLTSIDTMVNNEYEYMKLKFQNFYK
jgi:N-acetylglucosamine transport system substrate-binding protein